MKMTEARGKRSFGWTSPHTGSWMNQYFPKVYRECFPGRVRGERDFRAKLQSVPEKPDLMMMWNFVKHRFGVESICRELEIDVVHIEDGWFPHYYSAHADPLGFCWESSLPQLVFSELRDDQRRQAASVRRRWHRFVDVDPPYVKPPFVLWPLQLIGDQVNKMDLNLSSWAPLVSHFRKCLPDKYQLVIKPHPLSKEKCELLEEFVTSSPNTILLPKNTDIKLKSLLKRAVAVGGVNSTVLLEARLMFHKPTYVYGRSWFDNHQDLFVPVFHRQKPRRLCRMDRWENPSLMRSEYLDDYTDWFLSQLLCRQVTTRRNKAEPRVVREKMERLSYHAFKKYGEEVFYPSADS